MFLHLNHNWFTSSSVYTIKLKIIGCGPNFKYLKKNGHLYFFDQNFIECVTDNWSELVQIMAWCCKGTRPLAVLNNGSGNGLVLIKQQPITWTNGIQQPWLHLVSPGGPFYQHGLTLIPAWISNHMHSKAWYEITYPFPNFNSCTVEV